MNDSPDTPRRSALVAFAQHARRALVCGAAVLRFASPALAESPGPRAPSDAPVSTLAELRAFAEQHAPSADVTRRRRGYAAAVIAAASPTLHENPTLRLGAGPRFSGERRGLDWQAALAQSVEVAGERGLRRVAAARRAERLDAELELAELQLRRDVSLGYHAVVIARERLALDSRLRELAEHALRIARQRLSAGDVNAIDARIAEADAAQARATELAAEGELWSKRVELALVSGWDTAHPPEVAPGVEASERPPPLETLLRRERPRHPALEAFQAATREAHANVELADRRAWPRPTFAISLSRESSVESRPEHVVLASVELPLPLWSTSAGERQLSRVDEAVARAEQAGALREWRTRLALCHAALTSAAARLELLEAGAGSALEDGLALLGRSLEHGESSVLDVALARERLRSARLEALAARADYHRAQDELEYALGVASEARAGARPASTSGGAP